MATLTDREAKPPQMPMMSPDLSVGNQRHPKIESNASAAEDPLLQSMTEHGNTLSRAESRGSQLGVQLQHFGQKAQA